MTAFATAGHVVAVTRTALQHLPPNQLAAVLAHELGHHLGGHAWASLVTYWYSIPGRLFSRAWFWCNYIVFAFVAGFALPGPLVRVFPYLWPLAIAAAFFYIHPLLVLIFLTPIAAAWITRFGEKHADRAAADLGYGQPMIEVLHDWLAAGRDVARKRKGWRGGLFASHPTCAARIRALEKHMHGEAAGG